MDPKLAEMYGTLETDVTDTEKLAAAELAEELSEEGAVDTEGLTDDDLEAVAAEVLAAGETEETEEQTQGDEATEENEKVAEADHLGRVMAHAYVHELRSIEKSAAILDSSGNPMKSPSKLDKARAAVDRKVGPTAAKAKKHVKDLGEKAERFGRKGTDGAAKGVAKGSKFVARNAVRGARAAARGAAATGAHVMRNRGKYGLVGAALAAGGAAHHALKEKKSSALDTLVEQRALEILAASGIDPSQLEPVEQEKEAGADVYDALSERVEQGAWDLLAQYGVEPAADEE